jgi:hypothetical protein
LLVDGVTLQVDGPIIDAFLDAKNRLTKAMEVDEDEKTIARKLLHNSAEAKVNFDNFN